MSFRRLSSLIGLALFSVQAVRGASLADTTSYKCPTGQRTANSKCCALFPIVEHLQEELFEGAQCGEDAHSALRLAFHDAIGWSKRGNMGGGADGSSLVFADIENNYPANLGIDDITDRQTPFWKESGLTAGDFIHLAAAVGTANCPGAPRLEYKYGRPPPVAAAPPYTVPEPTDSVSDILDRFDDAGFNAIEVIALLASHSIAAADDIDQTVPGSPFDSTPYTFDTQYYLEVLLKGKYLPGNSSHLGEVLAPLRGEMRLDSDYRFAHDPRTKCIWQGLINQQEITMALFKKAMAKLQVLGQDTRKLVDCSDVIPQPKPFKGPIKYPASLSKKDVEISCYELPFPVLKTSPGPEPVVPPITGSPCHMNGGCS